MSLAFWPSTWSAFRPVATPLAVVVNGAAFAGPVICPTSVPVFVLNSNARPAVRLLARRHGSLPVAVPPAGVRRRVARATPDCAALAERAGEWRDEERDEQRAGQDPWPAAVRAQCVADAVSHRLPPCVWGHFLRSPQHDRRRERCGARRGWSDDKQGEQRPATMDAPELVH